MVLYVKKLSVPYILYRELKNKYTFIIFSIPTPYNLDKISYEYPNLEDECAKQKEPIKMVKVIKKKKRGKKNGRRKRS